ncbi:MAG TPA: CRISPR-associated protein Cas4 [Longimicrobium sp.]|jgi:CRISPR-associated exonuclease Cas4|nr:CRISPR-associated protein Cas4 [Longimicrobium sp.]
MYTEDELLPLSALQHLLFCERQCALIHVEGVWADNSRTLEGTHLHRRADAGPREARRGVLITRAVPLRSLRLGLIGKADVVEWHRRPDGAWQALPVEYKRGRPKRDRSDEVQVCAQALCLEEMMGITIPAGALFYGTSRRRHPVSFEAGLRAATEAAAARLHALVASGRTPTARREPKCESCSLLPLCLPGPAAGARSAVRYLERALATLEPIHPPAHGGHATMERAE